MWYLLNDAGIIPSSGRLIHSASEPIMKPIRMLASWFMKNHCVRVFGKVGVIVLLSGVSIENESFGKEEVQTERVSHLGPVRVGEPLPSFAGWSGDGELMRSVNQLPPDSGKSVGVVAVFATWCGPCLSGLKVIENISDNKDISVLLIAYGEDSNKVKPYMMKHGFRSPVMMDVDRKRSARIGVTSEIPKTIVVDSKGIVRAIFGREGADFEAQLSKLVHDLGKK
jgi:thiol-disulfide isomerase/thioredoxin